MPWISFIAGYVAGMVITALVCWGGFVVAERRNKKYAWTQVAQGDIDFSALIQQQKNRCKH